MANSLGMKKTIKNHKLDCYSNMNDLKGLAEGKSFPVVCLNNNCPEEDSENESIQGDGAFHGSSSICSASNYMNMGNRFIVTIIDSPKDFTGKTKNGITSKQLVNDSNSQAFIIEPIIPLQKKGMEVDFRNEKECYLRGAIQKVEAGF